MSEAEREGSDAGSMLLCRQEGDVMTWLCQEWQLCGSTQSQHTRDTSNCYELTSRTELNSSHASK